MEAYSSAHITEAARVIVAKESSLLVLFGEDASHVQWPLTAFQGARAMGGEDLDSLKSDFRNTFTVTSGM